ncbi:nectin-3-like [Xiphophorus couchianus]|uniref:nectin-3-like n=1 Tax=Xiphophorus couchianus TaxID=32473 RepID=UPI0010163ED0|nr:nectin-3-like [Xiphophorus couchianus]
MGVFQSSSLLCAVVVFVLSIDFLIYLRFIYDVQPHGLFHHFGPVDQRNITTKPGENVTLPCGAAENQHVLAVSWSRTDLGSDYVLLYRDEQSDTDYQSTSFKNRVDLKAVDRGDVSLILSNVTTSDAGTYECRVAYKDGNEKKRTLTLISTINLRVEPGNKDGGQDEEAKADGGNKIWQIVGWVVVVVAAAAGVVVAAVCKRHRRQRSLRPDANPPAEELKHIT